MNNFPQPFSTATPRCLAGFKTAHVDLTASIERTESLIISRAISCLCGNANLYLEVARRKDLRGTCRQEEIITFLPPVYVGCEQCRRLNLLFDPLIHGLKAQTRNQSDEDDADVATRLIRCTPHTGQVYVALSYRHAERYTALLADSVSNPEDYFDAVTVLFAGKPAGPIKQLMTFDCD